MANQSEPDVYENAARVVAESTTNAERLPAEIEGAWEAWIAGVSKVDDRARLLLRAAFEVGVQAEKSSLAHS